VVIAGTGVEREYLGSSGEDIAVCATISNEENEQQDSVGEEPAERENDGRIQAGVCSLHGNLPLQEITPGRIYVQYS
jgi:hypothetical protein